MFILKLISFSFVEIFGYSSELKKWIEVGNSGIFRPEMLGPMNLPDDVRVIAWGLSLGRLFVDVIYVVVFRSSEL